MFFVAKFMLYIISSRVFQNKKKCFSYGVEKLKKENK